MPTVASTTSTLSRIIEKWKSDPKKYALILAFSILLLSQVFFLVYTKITGYEVVGSTLISISFFAIVIPLAFLPLRDFSTTPKVFDEKFKKLVIDRTDELNFRMQHFTNEIKGFYDKQIDNNKLPEGADALSKYLIACVDKFVDEAQQVLTARAKSYYVFGTMAIIAAVGTLIYAGLLAYESLLTIEIPLRAYSLAYQHPTQYVIMRIFSALAVATAVYAIVKTALSYGISFFHEGTRLLDRRHALRFGRLYMYLKRENYNFEELEEAFQWHMDAQTIFQTISASNITESVFHNLIKNISEAADTISKVKKTASST